MNIQNIKNILDNESLIKKLKLDTEIPSNLKVNKPILKEILDKYRWLKNSNELIYLIKHKDELEKLHIFCPTCGNKNKFVTQVYGYAQHCSTKCSSLDPLVQKKSLDTSKINWGYDHPSQSPIIKKKHEDTNMQRHGVKSPLQLKEIHMKGVQKAATKEVRRKVANKKLYKYGNSGYHNFEQAKQTYYKRTGYITTFSNPEVREKSRQKFQEKYNANSYIESNEFKQEFPKIMQERFQTDNYCKSKDYKNKKDLIIQKGYETKKKNGTLGCSRSKAEIRCYEKLLIKFPNTRHSYYENSRYPFNCDMYVPELDLFIECHFSEYHHFKPFDFNCIGDLIELSKLKIESCHPLYNEEYKDKRKRIINTWTVSDPKKLKTFQDNRLNYKIFYTEKEFNEWFDSL